MSYNLKFNLKHTKDNTGEQLYVCDTIDKLEITVPNYMAKNKQSVLKKQLIVIILDEK